jgi:formate dehydrogenase subunit gamma
MLQVEPNSAVPDTLSDREFEIVSALLANTSTSADQLLPVLHAIQNQLGHISKGAIRLVAHAFNISRADVYGVVTFYSDFREEPVGAQVVQLCMAEACQAVGCRDLAVHAQRTLGVNMGATTANGTVHLEATYCLGNCALGPSVRINNRVYGRMTHAKLTELLMAISQTPAATPAGAK